MSVMMAGAADVLGGECKSAHGRARQLDSDDRTIAAGAR